MDLDYHRYASGEEQLAWLDQSIRIMTPNINFRMDFILFVQSLLDELVERRAGIGHIKIYYSPRFGQQENQHYLIGGYRMDEPGSIFC